LQTPLGMKTAAVRQREERLKSQKPKTVDGDGQLLPSRRSDEVRAAPLALCYGSVAIEN